MEKINWFWAHRRNTSLHHASLLLKGFKSKGYLPAVNFHFDNQIVIGKFEKGCYLFYDKDQMKNKYKDVQASIDNNKNFVEDFRETNDNIFKELFKICNNIVNTGLNKLSDTELLKLVNNFRDKITVGPLISVQLWGIEACWDPDYVLFQEVKKKVGEKEFHKIKGELSQSTCKSVAFSERESFLKTLAHIQEVPELSGAFVKNSNIQLDKFPKIKKKIVQHINTFRWIHSEYVSRELSLQEWLKLFQKEAHKDAEKELNKLYSQYDQAVKTKNELIKKLALSERTTHALNALNEFVAQRDWAKGKFCYALTSYNLLLEEISVRLNTEKEDVLHHGIDELIEALRVDKPLRVENRKQSFALIAKEGNLRILESSDVNSVIKEENIGDVFSEVKQVTEFKGVIACRGRVRGLVRVIDNPKEIPDFKDGEILVTYMTTMEFTPLFKKAKGIITDEGGLSSHAAIISREFGLPCVVGTQVATRTLKTGDIVELNADNGKIRIILSAEGKQ